MLGIGNMHNNINNIIKNDEKKEKNKIVLTASELIQNNYNRYLLMQKVLNPLLRILKKKVNVINISYILSNDELVILIEYINNNRKGFLSIKELELLDSLEINLDTSKGMFNYLITDYKDLIKEILLIGKREEFYQEYNVLSTSKLFKLRLLDKGSQLTCVTNNTKDYFNIINEYGNDVICDTSYPDIKELMSDEEVLNKFLNHIKVYEIEVPKVLIKK